MATRQYMEIPRFENQNINPRFAVEGVGEAFQKFVHELLLPDHPGLHCFPGGGKDGGIDLIEALDNCYVVECKVVGVDDYSQIEQRWKKVKEHLEEHLANANGPTSGQSQYLPWYSTDKPIKEYVFSVTAAFANEQQRRNLKNNITDFFRNLSKQRQHLSHLASLNVSVIDWNDLCVCLRKQPHLIFRWFPVLRPSGLVPLDEVVFVGTFRSYLSSTTLPYYSIAEHQYSTPTPENINILNEECLLAGFDNQNITGLIISGKGGIGKSRLTLELGWKAIKMGWSVMRVQGRLNADALDNLAEKLTSETPALLLIDYIETQNDFNKLVETLNILNDSGVAHIRYVAACRTGYYYKNIHGTERHMSVDLSPPPGDAALEWFSKYRATTVHMILDKAGITVTEQHIKICHDIPILAVFFAYLHVTGRNEELTALLSEIEFGQWVAKRLQLTFPSKDIKRDLALLIPLFPMLDIDAMKLNSNHLRPVFDSLASDGWIEKVNTLSSNSIEEWASAHDVLADQILLSYLHSIPNTAELFVNDLFSLASDMNCLSSAIYSLQRIIDLPPLNALPWAKIITNAINKNRKEWSGISSLLVRTTLLTVPEQIAFLYSHHDLWVDAEKDFNFQNALGWYARWIATADNESIPEQHKQNLIAWIKKAAPFVEVSNYVINWGLRLAPETFKDIALLWISTKPNLFQTHFLIVAWLESGQPVNTVAEYLRQWCVKYSRTFNLSFIVKAWLDAGGDKELVQEAIVEWLEKHKTDIEASHVYPAWLGAGGDKDLVRGAIKEWLDKHRTDMVAIYIYSAWLKAGGEKEFVQKAIVEWLEKHKTDIEASHVYPAWLDAGGEKELIQEAIVKWLEKHKTDIEASHVYPTWLGAGGDKDLVPGAIVEWLEKHKTDIEASHVYPAWLVAGGDKDMVQGAIKEWLDKHKTDMVAMYIYSAWLKAGGEKEFVQEAIVKWLDKHKTDMEARYIYNDWLDAGGDKLIVQDAIKEWLNEYKTNVESNHVYKAWLDADGDKSLVRGAIKEWLVVNKVDVDYICKAWLVAGGDKLLVQDAIKEWLKKYKTDVKASYVYKAWLDADGDRDLVQGAIKEWLVVNKFNVDFICKAWLNAGGDKALVRESIREWIEEHKATLDASYMYTAWLKAGGERDVVWFAMLSWLEKYRTSMSAIYVMPFVCKQPDIPITTVKNLLVWCYTFPDHHKVLWQLTQIGNKLFSVGIEEDVVITSEKVLEKKLPLVTQSDTITRGQVTTLISYLIAITKSTSVSLQKRVETLFVRWLRHPLSYGIEPLPHLNIQRVVYVLKLQVLIDTGQINIYDDRDALVRFMIWLNAWEMKNKLKITEILYYLQKKYPDPELWDIVRFENI